MDWGTVWSVVVALLVFFAARAVARSWATRKLDRLSYRVRTEIDHAAAVRKAQQKAGPQTRADQDAERDAALDSLAARRRQKD